LNRIAYLYFPACFARDESEIVLTEFMQGVSELIDVKAATLASVELRMAAIEGRAVDFDPDQTRADGPVGRKKIPNPPSFALEAMRTKQFDEDLAKLLFERTSSHAGYGIEEYASYQDLIDEEIAIGNDPDGSPYFVLNDRADEHNSRLTKNEMTDIAHELRTRYKNLLITHLSEDPALIRRERKYLDWFWKTFTKK
jgi:hypothetical protein